MSGELGDNAIKVAPALAARSWSRRDGVDWAGQKINRSAN